jgi:hypothetical protein
MKNEELPNHFKVFNPCLNDENLYESYHKYNQDEGKTPMHQKQLRG